MTVEELTAAQGRLREGVRARESIIMEMLDRDAPDVFVSAFTEGHIAGHQFLNLECPAIRASRPRSPPNSATSCFGRVFETVDAAVGRIVKRLPPETTVLIACMGGLRVTYGGSYFLEDLLRKTGLTASVAVQLSLARRLWRLLPERLRQAGRRRMSSLVRRAADAHFWGSFDWSATRAFALPWTYDGYLRVNLRGREPHGIVEPGAERSALLDEIEAMVGEMRIAGTDRPAARQFVRTQEVYVGKASAELPDLMVLWNNSQPIDAIVFSTRRTHPQSRHSTARYPHQSGGDFCVGACCCRRTDRLGYSRHRHRTDRIGVARDRAAEGDGWAGGRRPPGTEPHESDGLSAPRVVAKIPVGARDGASRASKAFVDDRLRRDSNRAMSAATKMKRAPRMVVIALDGTDPEQHCALCRQRLAA